LHVHIRDARQAAPGAAVDALFADLTNGSGDPLA